MNEQALRNPKSAKAVSFRTYLAEEQIRDVVASHDGMIQICVISYHDKDIHTEGENKGKPKEPHFHGYLLLDKSRELQGTRSWFKATDEKGMDVQTRIEAVLSTVGCDDYLTHDTIDAKQEGKHQYTEEAIRIIKGSREAFRTFKTKWMLSVEARETAEEKADEVENLLDDIIKGVPSREMARRYGRDYVKNVAAYRRYAAAMVFEEEGDLTKAYDIEHGSGAHAMIEEECNTATRNGMVDAIKCIRNLTQAKVNSGETYLNDMVDNLNLMLKGFE